MPPLSSQILPAMPTVLTVAIVFVIFIYMLDIVLGFPWWLSTKEFTCSAGDTGDLDSVSGLGRSPGGRHGNPLQFSCWENPMD